MLWRFAIWLFVALCKTMSASPGFALSAVRRCVASALRAVNDEGTNTIAMLLSTKPGGKFGRRSASDSEKPMWSIGAHETVASATARMLDARVGSLMVTTDPNGGEAVGILTERE